MKRQQDRQVKLILKRDDREAGYIEAELEEGVLDIKHIYVEEADREEGWRKARCVSLQQWSDGRLMRCILQRLQCRDPAFF